MLLKSAERCEWRDGVGLFARTAALPLDTLDELKH